MGTATLGIHGEVLLSISPFFQLAPPTYPLDQKCAICSGSHYFALTKSPLGSDKGSAPSMPSVVDFCDGYCKTMCAI